MDGSNKLHTETRLLIERHLHRDRIILVKLCQFDADAHAQDGGPLFRNAQTQMRAPRRKDGLIWYNTDFRCQVQCMEKRTTAQHIPPIDKLKRKQHKMNPLAWVDVIYDVLQRERGPGGCVCDCSILNGETTTNDHVAVNRGTLALGQ